jgi:hypothetical protein
VNVTYQNESAGGCSNTEAAVDGDAFVQRTGLADVRPAAALSNAATRLTLAGPHSGGRRGGDWPH